MTEETFNDDLPQESELESLKATAKRMGIRFHPSSGVDSLKAKINEQMGMEDTDPLADDEPEVEAPVETAAAMRKRVKAEATRLVRIRITCMNPAKKEWDGEIFTTGNSVTGSMKKYVQFDTEYHVPHMMLTMIQSRMCQVFHTVTDKRTRQKVRKGKLVKEFAVEVLPDLTAEELKDLALQQAMANGQAA
jgi:hypothetical protein